MYLGKIRNLKVGDLAHAAPRFRHLWLLYNMSSRNFVLSQ